MKKVFVGMSGGVDSSVSAALLKEQGFDVTGVFIQAWSPEWMPCTWREERRDAMRVAARLKIPFITLNLEKEYKRDVADYMIAEYKKGRTPNPDVMCNKQIKFGAFFNYAREQGADYIATGHYARVVKNEDGTHSLYQAKDTEKDQGYFLWTLTAEQLSKVIFPVGELVKSDVRALATKCNLPTADKKDSQGLCFIGKVSMKDFLSHYIDAKQGSVLNEKGESIGTHDGAVFYTLGERHGFTLTTHSPHDAPLYVVAKDMQANTITVSAKETKKDSHAVTRIQLSSLNLIDGNPKKTGFSYRVRIRYRQPVVPCAISNVSEGISAEIEFQNPEEAVASGQSAVLYDNEQCLGGGIIERAMV